MCRPAWSTSCRAAGRRSVPPLTAHRRRRLHLLHRRTGHRAGDHRGSPRTRVTQGRGRAGREEPAHRLRRRRRGETLGRPRADRGVPALRSGLLGRHPADRRRVDRRRLRRRAGPSGRSTSGSGTAWTRRPRPARWCRRRSWTRSRTSSRSASVRGRRARHRRHAADRPALADGYFFLPTIFDHCDRSMRIVREETFGPILTVERFTTEAEAIELGNDTEYGLAGRGQDRRPRRAERVARALRHGTVWINDFGYYTAAAEWGGFKKSGNGRELGTHRSGRVPGAQAHLAATRRRRPRAGSPARAELTGRSTAVDPSPSNHDPAQEGQVACPRQAPEVPQATATITISPSSATSQSLDRSIGKFASFAAGISYISILTGTFQLFYFGFGTGGPGLLWSLAAGVRRAADGRAVLRGAGRPVPGRRVRSTTGPSASAAAMVGWLAGWMMLTASIVTLSAVVLAYQLTLPQIWPGFQLIGDGSGHRLRRQRRDARRDPDRVHHGDQRDRRQADGPDQQHRGVHRADRRRADRGPARRQHRNRGPQVLFATHGYGAGESGGYFGASWSPRSPRAT